jgi:endonuclease/exonuclease/phosphatase family metal-dependent hydrolase
MRRLVNRKHVLRLFGLLLSLALVAAGAQADTLRVCTYNALNFRGPQDADRYDDIRIVMESIAPDMVAMQEIVSEDAVDGLLSFVFLQVNDDWAAAAFHDGRDTDNGFFYRTSKVSLVSSRFIQTTLRDIAEYTMQPVAPDTSLRLRVYSLHLKASEGSDNENRRRDEAAALRQQLDMFGPGTLFLVCGDYNLYTSAEPAYQLLLSPDSIFSGQLFDPINTPGVWHANPIFEAIHTQSPRSSVGGMDDRFDFILVSGACMDTVGSYVLPETYTPYGNDGRHFNQAINAGTNYAVPDSVANALEAGSDHLPVYVDLVMRAESSDVAETPPVAQSFELLSCYPNPFNPTLTVQLAGPAESVSVAVFDVAGRRVMERSVHAREFVRPLRLDFSGEPSGSYFVRAQSARRSEVKRVLLVR